MAISTDDILTALSQATYTLTSLSPTRFFKTKLPDGRRRFPSVELLETPIGNTATQGGTDFVRSFDIRIFLGLRGGSTVGQKSTITDLEILEKEIIAVVEDIKLLDHKLIIDERSWNREYFNNKPRPYVISILTIKARQITGVLQQPDGILVYDVSASQSVGNAPASDYQYTEVFNTQIISGYGDIDEYVNTDHDPRRYTEGFFGSFITNVHVAKSDLGITDDKLQNLKKLKSNGEKPIIAFIYTDKTEDTPTTVDIQRAIKVTIDDIKEMYKAKEGTTFTITAKLLELGTTSAN